MATSKRDKPRVGRTPDLLRKSGPMEDKTKRIPRKRKHKKESDNHEKV
jgi:hypothetical protein